MKTYKASFTIYTVKLAFVPSEPIKTITKDKSDQYYNYNKMFLHGIKQSMSHR